jgi:hypothetical protein
MKRKRRVILDVPSGAIDRGEVRKVFAELREKRIARERSAGSSVASDSVAILSPDLYAWSER